jgi:hypothetical protein
MSVRATSTLMPGFMTPAGSQIAFTAASARQIGSPKYRSWSAVRERPEPCSPLSAPP